MMMNGATRTMVMPVVLIISAGWWGDCSCSLSTDTIMVKLAMLLVGASNVEFMGFASTAMAATMMAEVVMMLVAMMRMVIRGLRDCDDPGDVKKVWC